jgi:hypothetical protein
VKYADGQDVMLGDKVRLGDDDGGVVVCSIDAGEYSHEAAKDEWSYLKRGVLIRFPKFGLIHYEEGEPDLALIERGAGHGSVHEH